MKRLQRDLAIGLPLIAIAACGSATGPAGQRAELAANRAKWERAGFVSYAYTFQAICFCAFTQPVRLSVANGTIVRAVLVANDSAISPSYFPTVDSLFAFVDRAIGRAAMLRVTYDRTLGYPTQIDYDGAANAVDDELTYKLSDLNASAPPP